LEKAGCKIVLTGGCGNGDGDGDGKFITESSAPVVSVDRASSVGLGDDLGRCRVEANGRGSSTRGGGEGGYFEGGGASGLNRRALGAVVRGRQRGAWGMRGVGQAAAAM
jgi:hypothetical protein